MSRWYGVGIGGIGFLAAVLFLTSNPGQDGARNPPSSASAPAETPHASFDKTSPDSAVAAGAKPPVDTKSVAAASTRDASANRIEEAARSDFSQALAHFDGRSESIFISDNALDAGRVHLLSDSNAYAEFIRDLNRNSSRESAARATTLRDQLYLGNEVATGQVAIENVGCGQKLCSFSVLGSDEKTAAAFANRQFSEPGNGVPFYSQTQLTGRSKGQTWVRVLISTDPSIDSLHISE